MTSDNETGNHRYQTSSQTQDATEDGPLRLRVAGLSTRAATSFDLRPGPQLQRDIAVELGLRGLRKARLTGDVRPEGRGWRLQAHLGATVVQDCVVTLGPVTTRIDEPVLRRYLPDVGQPAADSGEEVEMPADDSIEPLPREIDLVAVLQEALALALPAYPRAEGAGPGDAGCGPAGPENPDAQAIDASPFAALAGLRDKLPDKD